MVLLSTAGLVVEPPTSHLVPAKLLAGGGVGGATACASAERAGAGGRPEHDREAGPP